MADFFTALSKSGKLPQLGTKRALLVIDMQSSVLDGGANGASCQPMDLLKRTQAMIPHYRKLGELVWVSTETSDGQGTSGTESQQHEAQKSGMEPDTDHLAKFGHPESALEARKLEFHGGQAHEVEAPPIEFTMATRKQQDDPAVAHQDRGNTSMASWQQNEKNPSEARSIDMLAYLVDGSKDLIIRKPRSSAFDSTALLLSLRMKLVTQIYLCGTLTNAAIYDTAADAVSHGFEVTVVEDCLGYYDIQKHIEAMTAMADHLGVSGIDSEEIKQEATDVRIPQADDALRFEPAFSGLRLSQTSPEQANTKPDLRMVSELSAEDDVNDDELPPEKMSISGALANLRTQRQGTRQPATTTVSENIGEGDSTIQHDLLPAELAEVAFERVMAEAEWQTMHHRSGEVPRLVAVQGGIGDDGSKPVYRHPADESPPLSTFTHTVDQIRIEVEKVLKHPLNHVLIQLYRSGHDHISEHSDKTLDIARGSFIANVSLGASRTMTLRTKKTCRIDAESLPQTSLSTSRQSQRIPLPHNSIFVLGPATNIRWLHAIRPDRRPAPPAPRISLTFRRIATFLDASGTRIWGQGARAPVSEEAHAVSRDPAEMLALVRAFGLENQRAETFVWEEVYGGGFDALDMPPVGSQGGDRDGGGNPDRGDDNRDVHEKGRGDEGIDSKEQREN